MASGVLRYVRRLKHADSKSGEQMKRLFYFFLFTSVALLFAPFNTQAQIRAAKQLTGNVGWVATSSQLFWTTDAGVTWRNITPPQLPAMISPLWGISAVFFVDNSNGWVVFHSCCEEQEVKEGADDSSTNQFFLASTNDAGADWSYRRVSTSEVDHARLQGSRGLADGCSLWFTDVLHGVMNITIAVGSGPGIYPSFLLATSDGGKTWKDIGGGTAGNIMFTTSQDGWVAGGDGLFMTRDAGKHWKEVVPHAPATLQGARAIYESPIFPDNNHGFLKVEYQQQDAETTVLFSTLNGGRTWKLNKVLPYERKIYAVANRQWRGLAMKDHRLILTSPLTSVSLASARIDANLVFLYSATFLDARHAWALVGAQGDGAGQILSTSDGGATWNQIMPHEARVPLPSHPQTGPSIWKTPPSQ
jgi:photosystem II stability/assembly factor-like uncharacterized protein